MSTVISAEIPDSLESQLTERQEPDESRSAAIRRTLRDGTDAPELRRENRKLQGKLEDRENEIEELRDELDARREKAEESIVLPQNLTIAAAAWIGAIMLADGAGWINISLQVGTAELGIVLLISVAVYAVYRRFRGDSE
ncbi:hypothetical protein ACYJ1Y_18285 [Natrialbaceae archaeon A-gly3]